MRIRDAFSHTSSLMFGVAVVAFIGSLVFAARSVTAVLSGDGERRNVTSPAHSHIVVFARKAYDAPTIHSTIVNDPFNAARKPSALRFRFPGEGLATDSSAIARAAIAQQPIRLVGTVVDAEGSGFAICQLGQQAPRVVHLRERFGSLTLRKVQQERAVFSDSTGATVILLASKVG
jgi:hypothetical protein